MFKYEYWVNGVLSRSIAKCWVSLLYIEYIKDLATLQKIGDNKEIKEIKMVIKRVEK